MQSDVEQSQLELAIQRRLMRWAGQVHATATSLRRIRREVEALGLQRSTPLVEATADRMDDLGTYLENADLERLVSDLRTYAREHPAVVVAGAVGVGFATARLMKPGNA